MSEKILIIDLNNKSFSELPYSVEQNGYGRGLVLDLMRRFVPDDAARYSPDNAIVIAPGLFAGNKASSACRMFVAAVEDAGKGIQLCNTTGNLPQKIGSLGIAAMVIKGIAHEESTIVRITGDGVEFVSMPELTGVDVRGIVHGLKNKYNNDIGIIGTGKCGDMRMSLSSVFLTYPDGYPEYHSPRSGFGDVFGAKNLRAVVVDSKDYFGRDNMNPDDFWKLSKELTQKIINDEVCGGALPTYGSITIMKILKSRASLKELSELDRKKSLQDDRFVNTEASEVNNSAACTGNRKTNRTCAPLCAIGCLNRHSSGDGRKYESPSQVEVEAAVKNCFGVDDYELSRAIQNKATEMSLVSVEYVTSAKAYAGAMGIEHGEEHLLEWLDEIEKGSETGRIIGSRTYGIGRLFADKNIQGLMDRRAIQDEKLFEVSMDVKYPKLSGLSPMELLYTQIFVLENLGFCIFTSFALLDSDETFELLAKMFSLRTGIGIDGETLLVQAHECIEAEKEYEKRRWMVAREANIPPFTKVLYRYFDNAVKE